MTPHGRDRDERADEYNGDTRGDGDLTFSAEEREVIGCLGPNGAERTTAIRTMLGFQSPPRGAATVPGPTSRAIARVPLWDVQAETAASARSAASVSARSV